MVEIRSQDELEVWSKDKPHEWSAVVAARIALRVLPFIGTIFETRRITDHKRLGVILAVLRSNLTSWSASRYRSSQLANAAVRAALAGDAIVADAVAAKVADVLYAALNAANAAAFTAAGSATYSYSRLGHAATASVVAARGTAGDQSYAEDAAFISFAEANASIGVWRLIERDAALLEAGTEAMRLAAQGLWGEEEAPPWFFEQKGNLDNRLIPMEGDWDIWSAWYDDRVNGRTSFGLPEDAAERLDVRIATQPSEFWMQQPDAVNADIKAWLDEARKSVPISDEAGIALGEITLEAIEHVGSPPDSATLRFGRPPEELEVRVENASTDLNEERQAAIAQMIEWFFENYEDPAQNTPYESAEGGFNYIYGGPYDARDELSDQFSDRYSDSWIEIAVEEIERDGILDWAPTSAKIEADGLQGEFESLGNDGSGGPLAAVPEIPSLLPAAVEPEWKGGRLTLPARPAFDDLDLPLNFHPAAIRASAILLRYHSLDRRMLEFPAFVTMVGRQRHHD